MRFLSLCSGIEAASVAWAPMGWNAAAVAEIEAFPSAVLAHHYPDVPNLGDITKFKEWPDLGTIDLICGGTPCQSFSIAGLRKGLADPRGNLSLTFLAIIDRYRPRYVVWENVPGVFSSTSYDAPDPCPPPAPMDLGCDGAEMDTDDEFDSEELHAFNSFLAGVSELGYGWAYVVRDAQHVRVDGFGRAVPQRRRRVFLVGYLGDWRRAAAVLLEPESLFGDSPPRREAGQGTAVGALAGTSPGGGWRVGADEAAAGQLIAFGGNNCSGPIEAAARLAAHGGPAGRMDFASETFIATRSVAATLTRGAESQGKGGYAGRRQEDDENLVAHSLRAGGFDASEDGTGRGTPLVPVAYSIMPQNSGKDYKAREVDVAHPLMAGGPVGGNQGGDYLLQPVAFDTTQVTSAANRSNPKQGDPCHPLAAGAHPPAVAFAIQERAVSENPDNGPDGIGVRQDGAAYTVEARSVPQAVATGWAVRRLMPVECERLMGFPDGYTDIPYRGKPAADGPRYKALGNSWAVNVARWVGRRIEMVEQIAADLEKEAAA